MTKTRLEYEVSKSRNVSDEWRVEAINWEGEGECYVTLFPGLLAEERAKEYANWKNGGVGP